MKIDQRYECLRPVLQDMADQIQKGKGIERHGSEVDFKDQHTWQYMKLTGPGGPLFQMLKKATEAIERMEGEDQYHELIGALNYGVFAAMLMRDKLQNKTPIVYGKELDRAATEA